MKSFFFKVKFYLNDMIKLIQNRKEIHGFMRSYFKMSRKRILR
jgi:hypothetical protein